NRLFRDVAETDQRRGRRPAIQSVERWLRGDDQADRHLECWRRDRVAACAYHELEQPMRAARCLKASLVAHHCQQGPCTFAATALQYLYVAVGDALRADLTARFFVSSRGPVFGLPYGPFLEPTHVRRLIRELVYHHRDGPADRGVLASIAELRHEDA